LQKKEIRTLKALIFPLDISLHKKICILNKIKALRVARL